MDRSITANELMAATRMEHVRYAIRDLAVLAEEVERKGHRIIPLNIGDPLQFDFATPPHMIEAVSKAMADGKNGYAPSLGAPEAIQAVRDEAERKGIRSVQAVYMTAGVSEAVDAALTALVNPGENVLTPQPEYPLYSAVLGKLGATPNHYPLDEAAGWQPNLDEMARRISPKTRAIVIINPNNPTGAIYSRETLARIAELARRRHLAIISDEIYDKLILDDTPHEAIAALAPDVPVVTLGGLSKSYVVPGWRVGWAVMSGERGSMNSYLEGFAQLLRSRLSANHPQQYAVRPALEGPQYHLEDVRAKLRRRRDVTVAWCARTPRLSCVAPRGAFYAFPKMEIEESDEDFVKRVLREKHVLAVHGSGFGEAQGTRHMRVVFLPDDTTLELAYGRISELL